MGWCFADRQKNERWFELIFGLWQLKKMDGVCGSGSGAKPSAEVDLRLRGCSIQQNNLVDF